MQTKQFTILLVEDDEGHATLIQMNLKDAGLKIPVQHVADGQLALDYVRQVGEHGDLDYLLILLDLNLPVVDGYGVIEHLKSTHETSKIPIIVLTSSNDNREIERCYALGCSVYVRKPVNYRDFAHAVKQLGTLISAVDLPEDISDYFMEAPIRVLYIEDDPGAAELIRIHLEKFGYTVMVAADGESGLALCANNNFDVVLIDQTLPGMLGLNVLRELHRVYDFPPTSIMLTGTGHEQLAVDAMKSGADDYIVKDVTGAYFDLLESVIVRVLDNRNLRHNHERMLIKQTQLIEELQAFGYAVAHDLKQPLTMLQASLHLLKRYIEAQDGERTQQKLNQVQEVTVKMNDTLDALILFARLRETRTIVFEPVDVRQIVLGVVHQLNEMIVNTKSVVTIQEEMPLALGYGPWVERIWINYLSNAIKFGGIPPVIQIGASPHTNGTVSYWVKDNGTGLTIKEMEKLFIPFSRLRERRVEGNGLGLAIVRLIVRRLRGEATATSIPGKGSTFSFILPAADRR